MVVKFVLLSALCALSTTAEDNKWVWGDNNRDESVGRLNYGDRESRYEVFEHERPHRPSGQYYERPQYRPEFNPSNRPGGVYGGSTSGTYGHGHHYPTDNQEILTGPVPSWVKDGPFKDYDKCKCTEKFNCPVPGISYGHCDAGKQYCCFSTKTHDLGGPLPSRPVHSIENGILVGPGGPVDTPRPGGFHRPGRPVRPGNGFGLGGGGGRGEYGPIGHRPVHSLENNGILVGPGGSYDRPGGHASYGFGRSGKN